MRVKNLSVVYVVPAVDELLGCETEIRMKCGEILDGMPIEMSYASDDSVHVMFEEAHGDYLWLDVNDIASIRRAA